LLARFAKPEEEEPCMPEDLATDETSRLISSTKVHGTAVYSRAIQPNSARSAGPL
jgi:hypothetical protein